jgi:hypothetical protein
MSKLQSVVDKFGKWKHVDMDRLQYNLNRKQSDLHRVVAHEAKAEQRQRISATQYEKMTAQWKKKIKEEEALVQELNSKLKRLEAREGFGSITAAGGGSAAAGFLPAAPSAAAAALVPQPPPSSAGLGAMQQEFLEVERRFRQASAENQRLKAELRRAVPPGMAAAGLRNRSTRRRTDVERSVLPLSSYDDDKSVRAALQADAPAVSTFNNRLVRKPQAPTSIPAARPARGNLTAR